ncbi:hypothetical protein NEMIN01_0625 [Nematocida minor]|uniref:uncharacterized protein n=1 Tax=Nematocida minor TaxID=1912983 RepID=UPI00221ED0BD|nr:uncharacterized protein NEMIN01_0625 [Nematocida minor]KAI5189672.1 hypothetical protein NEMIN01_0625 [Nematocida minor]
MILSFLAKKSAVSDRTVLSYLFQKLIVDVDKTLLSIVNKESNSENANRPDEDGLIQSRNDAVTDKVADNVVKYESSSKMKRYSTAWLKLFALFFFVSVLTFTSYLWHGFMWMVPLSLSLNLYGKSLILLHSISLVIYYSVIVVYFTLYPIYSLFEYMVKSESLKIRNSVLYVFLSVVTYSTAWFFAKLACNMFLTLMAILLCMNNIGFIIAVLFLLFYIGYLGIEFANLFMGEKHGNTWRKIGVAHQIYILYLMLSSVTLLLSFFVVIVVLKHRSLSNIIYGIQSTLVYLFKCFYFQDSDDDDDYDYGISEY